MIRGRRRTARVAAARGAAGALAAALLLAACSPLYLPPLPGDALVPEPRLRLAGGSALTVEEGTLQLGLEVAEVPEEGWLAVQWFGPSGGAIASESLWLAPADAGETRTLTAPPELELRPGEWRAVASWYGRVVRQFRVVLEE